MQEPTLEQLRYPIGTFKVPENIPDFVLRDWITDISHLPAQMKKAVEGLSETQLELPYRPGGWTIRQTVNHTADSHMNAIIRFKLALTESTPTIKPYEEHLWAELADGKNAPIEWSLILLEMLHQRWTMLLNSMKNADFEKKYYHPEVRKESALRAVTGMYSWHGKHHVAHITEFRKRSNI
ncbi:DinB superfamily protein [Pseudarcicella hirudinis]|uniref:DinB superfamily protein n=1 Tax=Pseudarcicella hirudinis TaxID=1079859 RepID=A0A1I5U8T4_9BACT|nr:putative metal-dependent hydrolase [Pseudarcicella hirudinis]SFP91660.1 DinB superfamily protein [Pseudarcicella hirudinis]